MLKQPVWVSLRNILIQNPARIKQKKEYNTKTARTKEQKEKTETSQLIKREKVTVVLSGQYICLD